jgi:glycosyltransferase involved in cell wall biosynthesis
MRVGLVAPPWLPVPPAQYGGTESVIDRVARGLVEAGHEVLLAAPDGSSCPVPRVAGLGPAEPDRIGQVVVEVPYALAAYEALRGVQLVHDHTVVGPLCARVANDVQLVTTTHGPFDENSEPIYREMSRRGIAVVAISEHQASTAPDVQIAAVIHHGIDVEDVPVGDGGGGYACFLGRMVPDKGVREAILAAREADLPLRIAAKKREPEELAYFDEVVEPMLGGNISYVGELDHEEKYELLGNAIALVNPLQWPEPFGLVMIEALACGTPVIASSSGSVPEIVTDGVTGFIREDTESVAEALRQAPKLSRAACRESAETSFSTTRMVADHIELYERLLLTREAGSP